MHVPTFHEDQVQAAVEVQGPPDMYVNGVLRDRTERK